MLPVAVRSFLHCVLLWPPLVAGCSYTEHAGVMANGTSSQLYFSGAGPSSGASAETLALGYAAKVVVQRYGPSDIPCTGLGVRNSAVASGEVRIQGGDLGADDHCAGRLADAVTLVSAACTDDTCNVTADTTDPRAITLTVTGAHAGTGHIAVSLASTTDGHTYEDSIPLRFAAPARIRVGADARYIDAMNGPVLPGVAIARPSSWVVDADDERLVIADGALQATTEGDAYADVKEFPGFVAKHAGHTVLRWSYPGIADRTLDLEVVDPSEAHALFVYARAPRAPDGTASKVSTLDPAEQPPSGEPSTGRLTTIELAPNDHGDFPIRVRLDDGRFAMAVVDDPVLAPAALGSTFPGIEPSSFDLDVSSVGHGTITLRAAPGAATTLAVDVTARPSR